MNDSIEPKIATLSANNDDMNNSMHSTKSSTCLLIPSTPSPHPMDFIHPLSEETTGDPYLTSNMIESSIAKIKTGSDRESSSSTDSVVQDPVSAQLINNISMLDYQTLSKNDAFTVIQEENPKLNGNLNTNNRKLPNFVKWNWILIRKVMIWIILSGLIACFATIIGMIISIPKVCNPELPWYQGKIFYEIFPASFEDSNGDGIGDFKGLLHRLDYIENLGVAGVRMNYIFEAKHYPKQYFETTNLLKIDKTLGDLKDFQNVVVALHDRKMSLILDIPVLSLALHKSNNIGNKSYQDDDLLDSLDITTSALAFWARVQNVDGFYLKNLEHFARELNFFKSLELWKHIIGDGKILIVSKKTYDDVAEENREMLLSKIDLVDIHLDLQEGKVSLKNTINHVINGPLWLKHDYPWVHWNIGNVASERIFNKYSNNTLALTALQFVLPGTVNIFYGDEIGLKEQLSDNVEKNFQEIEYIHNLVPMTFSDKNVNSRKSVSSWHSNSIAKVNYSVLEFVKSLIKIKLNTPTLYLRAIYKDGIILKSTEIRKTENDLVVIERSYPRRNTFVFVGNLGVQPITTDLSTMFYGGTVVVSTNLSQVGETLYFDKVTFLPNSALILKLEK